MITRNLFLQQDIIDESKIRDERQVLRENENTKQDKYGAKDNRNVMRDRGVSRNEARRLRDECADYEKWNAKAKCVR
jgi:hypothetical protein